VGRKPHIVRHDREDRDGKLDGGDAEESAWWAVLGGVEMVPAD